MYTIQSLAVAQHAQQVVAKLLNIYHLHSKTFYLKCVYH